MARRLISFREFLRSPEPPSPPIAGAVRLYAPSSGGMRTITSEGVDEPVAGAGNLPNPTQDGDVLTVVEGEWAGAPGGGSVPGASRWKGPIIATTFAGQGVDASPPTVSGGTYTISYKGDTTTLLPWDASATDVKAALEALPSITGTLTVTIGPEPDINNGPYVIFDDPAEPTEMMTADASSLTGPDSPYEIPVTAQSFPVALPTLAEGDILEDILWYTPTPFDSGSLLQFADSSGLPNASLPAWTPNQGSGNTPKLVLDQANVFTNFGTPGNGDPAFITSQAASQFGSWIANTEAAVQYLPVPAIAAVTIYAVVTPVNAATQGELHMWVKTATPTAP